MSGRRRLLVLNNQGLGAVGGGVGILRAITEDLARDHELTLVSEDPPAGAAIREVALPRYRAAADARWRLNPWLKARHIAQALDPRLLGAADLVIVLDTHFAPALRAMPQRRLLHLSLSCVTRQEWFASRGTGRYWYASQYAILERSLVRRAAAVVVASPMHAEELAIYAGGDRRRMHIMPPVFATARPAPRNAARDILVALSRITPVKNLGALIPLLARCPGARLAMIGDGEAPAPLQAEAARLGVAERIEWVGAVQDPSPWLDRALLLLHPSRYESFGMAVHEAMRHGEPVLLDRVDFFLGKLGRPPAHLAAHARQRAEGAVILVPPRAPGDLRHFRREQTPLVVPVELGQPGERHMADVKVQPHADRVGGDDIIDLARLEHRHLAVARLRAQCAHHHRRPAPEAPQHLGHGIDLLGGEGDDGAPRRHPAELARADMPERREARAGDHFGPGQQRADQRLERACAEQHRLLAPARVEQPVGEYVAAFGIGGELGFVQRDERMATAQPRHSFGRAQEIARALRLDAFLAGDQRHLALALERDHPVIDLARQQPQGEADRAARMAAHPLDREMGLAGVGGSENRLDRAVGHMRQCGDAKVGRQACAGISARPVERRTRLVAF
ncbi:glycosyltransferase [Leptolyngbya sp. 15MV]|nr:glycosyltransferase [Leptolyngbya sp. 15MV]